MAGEPYQLQRLAGPVPTRIGAKWPQPVQKRVDPAKEGNTHGCRVSLCMIVKNEEQHLAACLNSVADLVHEVIIVDTGSADRTKEIAQQAGARVCDFTWQDSFAAARNESLRHATGDWILWLDGDEWFDQENRRRLKRLFAMLGQENHAYMMKQWSVPENGSGPALVVDHARLFRNMPGVDWRHRIHEQILMSLRETGAKVVFTDIVLRHSGYQHAVVRKDKLKRNLGILLLEHQGQPDSAFTLFNLGGTYLDAGETDNAIRYLRRCLETAPAGATFLPKAYVLLAKAQQSQGQTAEALATCRDGKARFPNDVELWFEEGLLCQTNKDHAGAEHCFDQLLKLPVRPCYVAVNPGLRGHLARHHLALALRAQAKAGAAETQWRTASGECAHFGPAWLGLAEICLEQNRSAEVEEIMARLSRDPVTEHIAGVLRARLALARGEYRTACNIMQEAIALAPSDLWLRMLFCDIMLRHNQDLDETEKQLNAILALDPSQKRTRQRLEQIRQRRGRTWERVSA